MPSKLKKAIGAVKDQTSIGLAKVASNTASNLEVAILKVTTHDEVPMDERRVTEILSLVSSNKAYATACAGAIRRRISRTRNWIVALKSLMLVLRIFQDGDPYFPREVLHAMKCGARILNLSNFRDDSNSSPWDYTAFVRTFALYLDERLDCFLTGKLQRRYTNRDSESQSFRRSRRRSYEPAVRDMKPVMLLDKISYWQRLLDRAIATRPTGGAKSNNLVKSSLHAVVRESFDLYKDVSDGLALLLDSFFHLQYQSCVQAFQACVRASKQFEELNGFYELCKSNGVGRTSEYPSVQKISEELIETLQEFLKDQSSFPSNGRSPSQSPLPAPSSNLLLQAPPSKDSPTVSSHYREESFGESERYSDFGSYCTSLEDLMSINEAGASPAMSSYSEPQKQTEQDDIPNSFDTASNYSLPNNFGSNLTLELVLFDDKDRGEKQRKPSWELLLGDQAPTQQIDPSSKAEIEFQEDKKDGNWELVLQETVTQPVNQFQDTAPEVSNGIQSNAIDDLFVETAAVRPQKSYNPFLEELVEIPAVGSPNAVNNNNELVLFQPDIFAAAPTPPTFQATAQPTFQAHSSDKKTVRFANEDDPFAVSNNAGFDDRVSENGFGFDQSNVMQEQQLWLQNQNKIIAKHSV